MMQLVVLLLTEGYIMLLSSNFVKQWCIILCVAQSDEFNYCDVITWKAGHKLKTVRRVVVIKRCSARKAWALKYASPQRCILLSECFFSFLIKETFPMECMTLKEFNDNARNNSTSGARMLNQYSNSFTEVTSSIERLPFCPTKKYNNYWNMT